MKSILIIIISSLIFSISFSQELNCRVSIVSPTLKSSPENTQLLDGLKSAITNIMNSTKWTDDIFQDHEKIDCEFVITVNEIKSQKNYKTTLQVISRRPVYNSSYSSPLVQTLDKNFNFSYELGAPINITQGVYNGDLPGILAFYAYYIIGMDYDSYSLEGGTPYFLKAQEISNLAQSSGGAGWASSDRNNRYWIIENILNAQFKQMRKSVYEYHRLGMDVAYDDVKGALKVITKALTYLQDVHARQPGSLNMRIYFVAKSDEVVNVFSEADPTQKNTVFNIVRRIDPGNIAKYQKIIKR